MIEITASQMVQLERVFHAESQNADGLDMDQFVCVFERVLGQMAESESRRYLTHLFMKIDANCDGTVDWTEFLNFLLNESEHRQRVEGSEQFDDEGKRLFVRDLRSLSSDSHSDSISAIIGLPNEIISGSLDGTIKVWDRCTLQNRATIVNSPNKKRWVTDLCHLPLSQLIAAVSMDGIVNFYDANSYKLHSQISDKAYVYGHSQGQHMRKEEKKWQITSTPCCADGAVFDSSANSEILSVGTESGLAFCYILKGGAKNFHICSGDQSHGGFECSHLQPLRIGIEAPLILDLHTEWISNIEFIHSLQCLVSSSLDSQIKFLDIERRKKQRVYSGHKGGVYSFAYNKEYKFMASCGVQRKIEIFEPNRCKMSAQMIGHQSSVLRVLMNEGRHQIISLAMDKTIKVWDDRTFRCMQTFSDNEVKNEQISSILALKDSLISTTRYLQRWELKTNKRQKQMCSAPISAAFFNPHFAQIVSSDFEGNVNVWDIESGSATFKYSQGERITALCFDQSKRRIISGSECGALRMWNFSSGQCLLRFRDDANCKYAHWKMAKNKKIGTEISGIVYAMEASFWSKEEVRHWFDSLRDKSVRNLSKSLGDIDGRQLLKLNHFSLRTIYQISEVNDRRKLLAAICSLYQSNIASRYIVSIGWDNRLRVWLDSSAKKLQMPLSVIDSAQPLIVCIAHYPPNCVVTGGCDGSICLYNVVSAHFESKFDYPSHLRTGTEDVQCSKIESLSSGLIVSAHSNGLLVFWSPTVGNGVFGWRHTSHRRFGGISQMIVAKNSQIIVTADPCGFIQIFCLLQLGDSDGQNLEKCIKRTNIWNSGHSEISCIDYLDEGDLILSSGKDGSVILWSDKGFKIGVFGQARPWKLADCKTWIDQRSQSQMHSVADCPQSVAAENENENANKGKAKKNEQAKQRKRSEIEIDGVRINEDTLKLLKNEHCQLQNESLPFSKPQIRKKSNWMKHARKRQLKIFKMDQIPKESPFK